MLDADPPSDPPATTGTLVLVGSPLGNPADASARLARTLVGADLVAAEDTRRLHRLLSDLGVHRAGPVVSYFEDVERERLPRLLSVLAEGGTVALVTDAGMPSVSDPGYRAARAALAQGHAVTALPGPSAVTTALAVSGLACDRFCFEGFVPRRPAQRSAYLAQMADEPRTQVYFESPRRLAATLAAMAQAFGAQRPAAVCREMSKTYEQTVRDSLGALSTWAAGENVRGEITLVVQGAPAAVDVDVDTAGLAARVSALEQQGVARKEAIALVASSTGSRKRQVFDAVVTHKPSSS
jgi:16S rRNA (cytidine1402-2'-O)-methyltransferase